MARRQDNEIIKERILSACVKFFIEKGYHGTTVADILAEADATSSAFQKIFKNKEGVLFELVKHMYGSQFDFAECFFRGRTAEPSLYYIAETAIQLTMTEQNENIRDIYVEAYTNRESSEYIYENTARAIQKLFGGYLPNYTYDDFYELDIASAGIMRAYMKKRCDENFTLEKKIEKFANSTLRIFNVPQEEIDRAIEFIRTTDFRSVTDEIMAELFKKYRMKFNFTFGE